MTGYVKNPIDVSRRALAAALLDTSAYVPVPDILDSGPRLRDAYKPFPRGYRPRRPRKPRQRLGRPPCTPGTITYHDQLVRHFGRRKADSIGRLIQQGQLDGLPFVDAT